MFQWLLSRFYSQVKSSVWSSTAASSDNPIQIKLHKSFTAAVTWIAAVFFLIKSTFLQLDPIEKFNYTEKSTHNINLVFELIHVFAIPHKCNCCDWTWKSVCQLDWDRELLSEVEQNSCHLFEYKLCELIVLRFN